MNMEGEQHIAAPLPTVWSALNDPDVLRASIPGCQTLEKEAEDRFSAVVEVKIGPIGARFKGAVTLTDLNPPHGYTLLLEGNGGIAGSVKGTARVTLTEDNGGTRVAYVIDSQVGGRMAQLGGPIIDATAKQLADKFFRRFAEIVAGDAPDAAKPDNADASSVTAAGVASETTVNSGASLPSTTGLPGKSSPLTCLLGLVVAALVGFLIGRSQGIGDGDWMGLAIGLLLVGVAVGAFEYGRRAAAPTVVLDNASLRRLLEGDRS